MSGTSGRRSDLGRLLVDIRACTICAEHLPHGPRPIVQAASRAGLVIVGQAPGRRVHESGVPWDDPSGQRLRAWLGLGEDEFYDPDLVALVPMGFCYPGRARSGDLPPRPECAPHWHDRLLAHLPDDRVLVVLGTHAQARYVPLRKPTLTATVAAWREYLPNCIVLPHPSPRNQGWLAANPWFEAETVPAARERVREVLRR